MKGELHMKKYYTKKSIILIIITIILALIYSIYDFNGYPLHALLFKTLASITFVTLGYVILKSVNYAEKNKYASLIFYGLILGMFGDIFIELPMKSNVTIGASLFAIGHILYSIAFCYIKKFSLKHFIIVTTFSLLLITYTLFMPYINCGDMLPVILAYCVIISFMVGCALLLWNKNLSLPKKMCIYGTVLFLISDFILLHGLFMTTANTNFVVFLNTFTYYPGQILLALSLVDAFKRN